MKCSWCDIPIGANFVWPGLDGGMVCLECWEVESWTGKRRAIHGETKEEKGPMNIIEAIQFLENHKETMEAIFTDWGVTNDFFNDYFESVRTLQQWRNRQTVQLPVDFNKAYEG